ncbi:MAG: hypothetical protein J6Z79_06045 [Clostridia bacterium]|nr:hypothetical protein [Clostridia bacterium]
MIKFTKAVLIYRGETWEMTAGKKPVLQKGKEKKALTPDDPGDLAFLARDAAFDPSRAGDRLTFVTEEGEQTITDPGLLADAARFFAALWNGTREMYELRLHSFDGGGPEYEAEMDPPGIVTWVWNKVYYDADHDKQCGSGFDVIYTFRPLRPGKTRATVTGQAFYGPEPTRLLDFTVDDDLRLTVDLTEEG